MPGTAGQVDVLREGRGRRVQGRVCVIFHRLGPYHLSRVSAAALRFPIVAIEICARDGTYSWDVMSGADDFERVTLFERDDGLERQVSEVRKRVWAALEKAKPDIVAVPGWSSIGALAAIIWCWRTARPIILMSETTAWDDRRTWWKEAVKGRLLKGVDAALVGGSPQAAYIEALGVDGGRIFMGYDVVDNTYFAEGAAAAHVVDTELRLRLGLPRLYFLASGRFVAKKNLRRLIEAYARYRWRTGDSAWGLVLLGDGPLRVGLENLVDELGLGASVRMPGFKQYSELPAYYGLASAFVHPSTVEQWGLVVNEAMAAGLPVLVSSRCGCAEDLVEEGSSGYTFDPLDTEGLSGLMLRMSSGSCDLRAMGKRSREIIDRWTPGTFAEGLAHATEVVRVAPRPAAGLLLRGLALALMYR